jgi:rRNA maturation endonuclease Nob1
MEKEKKVCKHCGGHITQENRKDQFNRIKNGIKELFPKDDNEKVEEYTRNFLGFGSNYMYVCDSCGGLTKIIPDGRRKY